ncbi:hypothetical protein [Streptomyces sp. NPDC047868]|uniref:hypothetical protein n=1 Tax=Streptomyces sp. NPDC047868 TaxID=3155480 RepID=UPI0034522C9C
MTSTLTEKPVVGRRILFTRYSDLPDGPRHPGVIAEIVPTQGASLKIRLDGRRSNLHVPPDYQGLTYLDETGPVPPLPMGRFHPSVDELEGEWQGVPVCSISEDGDIVLLTTDRQKAVTAATAYLKDAWVDLDFVHWDGLVLRWAYFEWQPEDSDTDWYMHWCSEADHQAIQLYYLPA